MARPADPNARASLIAAARAEFARKGIRGARIEDITAACGLSKGAFYLHFTSKEALFGELVSGFTEGMAAASGERLARMERFLAEHGFPTPGDVATRSARYRQLVALETELDLEVLERMWAYRDVLDVLIRGSQGTAFESLVWTMVDAEVARVAEDYRRLTGGCAEPPQTTDPELFGLQIVGTYLLLAQRMGRAETKPDLAAWAGALQRMFREGAMPRAAGPEAAPAAARTPSPRRPRARATHRSTPRKKP
jgi:AcrR family transcriptional regulator